MISKREGQSSKAATLTIDSENKIAARFEIPGGSTIRKSAHAPGRESAAHISDCQAGASELTAVADEEIR